MLPFLQWLENRCNFRGVRDVRNKLRTLDWLSFDNDNDNDNDNNDIRPIYIT